MLKKLFYAALALLGLVFAFLVAAPGLMYEAGLSNIEGRPQAGLAPRLNDKQREWLRCELRADEHPAAPITNPWTLAWTILNTQSMPPTHRYPDDLAWVVARNYNSTHLKQRRGLNWHLSGAALRVWIVRHWTQDEMEAQAHASLQHVSRFRCPPGSAEWQQIPSQTGGPPLEGGKLDPSIVANPP